MWLEEMIKDGPKKFQRGRQTRANETEADHAEDGEIASTGISSATRTGSLLQWNGKNGLKKKIILATLASLAYPAALAALATLAVLAGLSVLAALPN